MNGEPPLQHLRAAALGGGHGLAAALSAWRRLTSNLTGIVTVADDGGSSGRLRSEFGILPPGDLRMALSALCADDQWGRTWAAILQHRFGGDGPLSGHATGNLLLAAAWDHLGDPVAGLDLLARLLGARGRVLPMAAVPLDIRALVLPPDSPDAVEVIGQVAVATAEGRVLALSLVPATPPACPQSIAAIHDADVVTLGPGSWFTSVIPHLLVPDLLAALESTSALRGVILNLDPSGETEGFSPENHLEVMASHAPGLQLDVVIADPESTPDAESLRRCAASLGAHLILAPVASESAPDQHDPDLLAKALASAVERGVARGRIRPWQ